MAQSSKTLSNHNCLCFREKHCSMIGCTLVENRENLRRTDAQDMMCPVAEIDMAQSESEPSERVKDSKTRSTDHHLGAIWKYV